PRTYAPGYSHQGRLGFSARADWSRTPVPEPTVTLAKNGDPRPGPIPDGAYSIAPAPAVAAPTRARTQGFRAPVTSMMAAAASVCTAPESKGAAVRTDGGP